jgi:Thioredoxin like C-terminal domain
VFRSVIIAIKAGRDWQAEIQRFHVTIGGAAPGDSHGADVDAAGDGAVTDQRRYQLVRQNGTITNRTFEIRCLDPGAQAYIFTFG